MRLVRIVWGGAVVFAVSAPLFAPSVAPAQTTLPTPGARVRVTAPDLGIVAEPGTLVGSTPESLTIGFPDRTSQQVIPIDKLARLEVSAGKARLAGLVEGGSDGALIGALIGVALGAAMGADCEGDYCAAGYYLLGAGGFAVGLIVGGFHGVVNAPDFWEEVSLRPPNELGLYGVGTTKLGLSIQF